MPWLPCLKARHEQQKRSDYLKNEPFSKSSNYFRNVCKKPLKKEHCVGDSFTAKKLRNNYVIFRHSLVTNKRN